MHFNKMLNIIVAYTSQDIIYRWNSARQVAIAEDMKLSQFDLIATPSANRTDKLINDGSNHVNGTHTKN